ncbi:MAG: hypothetical protein GYA15_14515 [Leptolinea sp.]|nr:hypothetical protein [Leptolinea sp.]
MPALAGCPVWQHPQAAHLTVDCQPADRGKFNSQRARFEPVEMLSAGSCLMNFP